MIGQEGSVLHKWMMTPFLVVLVSLLIGRAANAQEKGQTGMTMGYPASVGLAWQPTDGFALRPELSFSTMSQDSSLTGLRNTSTLGVGLSGLFYVSKRESLSAYVSPRFVYNRLNSRPSDPTLESNGNT
jgi:hypothetical protein